MNSERSQAYGRVIRTLAELGPTKLHPGEQERLRQAADTLLFCEDPQDQGAIDALHDAHSVLDQLVASGRWSEERAGRLADEISACGPLAAVG